MTAVQYPSEGPLGGVQMLTRSDCHLLPIAPDAASIWLPGHLWHLHPHLVSLLFQPVPGCSTPSVGIVLLSLQH